MVVATPRVDQLGRPAHGRQGGSISGSCEGVHRGVGELDRVLVACSTARPSRSAGSPQTAGQSRLRSRRVRRVDRGNCRRGRPRGCEAHSSQLTGQRGQRPQHRVRRRRRVHQHHRRPVRVGAVPQHSAVHQLGQQARASSALPGACNEASASVHPSSSDSCAIRSRIPPVCSAMRGTPASATVGTVRVTPRLWSRSRVRASFWRAYSTPFCGRITPTRPRHAMRNPWSREIPVPFLCQWDFILSTVVAVSVRDGK